MEVRHGKMRTGETGLPARSRSCLQQSTSTLEELPATMSGSRGYPHPWRRVNANTGPLTNAQRDCLRIPHRVTGRFANRDRNAGTSLCAQHQNRSITGSRRGRARNTYHSCQNSVPGLMQMTRPPDQRYAGTNIQSEGSATAEV